MSKAVVSSQMQQQEQQEIGLSPIDLNGFDELAKDAMPKSPQGSFDKLKSFFRKAKIDPNETPMTRAEKKAHRQLNKAEKKLRQKEKKKEVATKEWSTYSKIEKISFIFFTFVKVFISEY